MASQRIKPLLSVAATWSHLVMENDVMPSQAHAMMICNSSFGILNKF
jgi:hypothetical protein